MNRMLKIRNIPLLDEGEREDSTEEESLQEKDALLTCHECSPPDCETMWECYDAVQCWSSIVRDSVGAVHKHKGCLKNADRILLTCNTRKHMKKSKAAKNQSLPDYTTKGARQVRCCGDRDFCNDDEFPDIPVFHEEVEDSYGENDEGITHFDATQTDSPIVYIAIGGGLILLLVILISWGIFWIRKTHKKRMNQYKPRTEGETFINLSEDQTLHTKALGDSTLKEFMDGTMSSGSGAGLPLLVQRTLAKNIQLVECIGKGRYGEVWRGVWNCESVAVKVFSTRDEASWIRETEIYSTVMLRHNNVLGFYGSDMTSRNGTTQLWLVTHYHRHGSLYDYLNKRSLTQVHLLKMAYSIANGLAFLHSEMVGTESRPGISHRDIKSKNILVTSHETCVIADFGLAVTHKRDTGELNVFPNPKVGTKRYMSPEVLDESMNPKSFDSYKRVDMYAFALVLWEMCRRTNTSKEPSDEYQPPFYDVVSPDPSFDEMRKVVCLDNYRPELKEIWISEPVLSSMSRIIMECWHSNPSVRLSSLRVKKSIAAIANGLYEGELEAVSNV